MIVGVVLILVACLGASVALEHAHTDTATTFFAIDPETGVLAEHVPADERSSFVSGVAFRLHTHLFRLLLGLWLGLVLVISGLRRRERVTGLPLRRIALPALIPLGVFGAAAWLLLPFFDGRLEALIELVAPERVIVLGHCLRYLSGCSTLLGYELLRGALLAAIGLAALVQIPAGRAAWRAGASGHALPGWARTGAVTCFLVGAGAFVATRGVRLDARASLEGCAQSDTGQIHSWVVSSERNSSSTQIQAPISVPDPQVWERYEAVVSTSWDGPRRYLVTREGAPQSRSGEPLSEAEFAAMVHAYVERRREEIEGRGTFDEDESDAVDIELYVDERAELEGIAALVRVAAAVGATHITLLGQADMPGSLPSLGEWRWRFYQPYARLDLRRSGGHHPGEFETWAALSSAAHEAGPVGLPIAELIDALGQGPHPVRPRGLSPISPTRAPPADPPCRGRGRRLGQGP